MSLNSERIGTAAAAFSGLCLLGVVVGTLRARDDYARSVELVDRAHRVVEDSYAALDAVVEAGARHRTYVVVGDPELAADAARYPADCEAALLRLREHAEDDPQQAALIDRFAFEARTRFAAFDRVRAYRDRGDEARAKEALLDPADAAAGLRLRRVHGAIGDAARARLADGMADVVRATAAATRLAWFAACAVTATLAGAAILIRRDLRRRKRAAEFLRDLSNTDPLTRLANRRAFDERLAGAIGRVRAGGAPFALVLADIDRFKTVNDAYGHAVGDDVLRWTSDRLRDLVREGDAAARVGGEEFALLLFGVAAEEAPSVLERLRARFAEQPFLGRDADGAPLMLRVTMSFGAQTVDAAAAVSDAASIYARTDAAMYAAKRAGRNRVEFVGARVDGRARGPLRVPAGAAGPGPT